MTIRIHCVSGDLLNSDADVLINTVNTVGVMGKGIALAFKNRFPNMFNEYKKLCNEKKLHVGEIFSTQDTDIQTGKTRTIYCFPTKKHWRNPSEMSYIESGMSALIDNLRSNNVTSIAIPPLGCGCGGLDKNLVKKIIIDAFRDSHLSHDIDVYLYNF